MNKSKKQSILPVFYKLKSFDLLNLWKNNFQLKKNDDEFDDVFAC